MSNLPEFPPRRHVYNVLITRQKQHLKTSHPEIGKKVHPSVLLKQVDLRRFLPTVYDQGELGSCTANALAGAVQFDLPKLDPSRLFIYYNERVLENDIPDDAGASLSDGVKTLTHYGVCPETDWPYDISKFATKPPPIAYTHASLHHAHKAFNVNNDLHSMKSCLCSGFPFVVGISIYSSFEDEEVAKTGVVQMPDQTTEECLGGHAVLVVGYDDQTQRFSVRNSWGTSWGNDGYFTLPYAYLLDSSLSSDLWVIQSVDNQSQ